MERRGIGSAPLPPPPPVTRTNGLAVASLVLGILSIVLFWTFVLTLVLAGLAIVFGVIGRRKARDEGAPNGGLATAGLTTGIVGFALGVLLWLLVFPTTRVVEVHSGQVQVGGITVQTR